MDTNKVEWFVRPREHEASVPLAARGLRAFGAVQFELDRYPGDSCGARWDAACNGNEWALAAFPVHVSNVTMKLQRQGVPEDLWRGRYFRCRLVLSPAIRLAERKADQRALDRGRKIAKRLHNKWGGTTEDEYDFPPKPPPMRWATYSRLEAQYDDLENWWVLGIMARFTRY